ncbi:MAG: MFS transporter [Chloroflexota bacterium]
MTAAAARPADTRIDPRANPDGRDPIRRRSLHTLVAGVGLGSTGYIAAVTVATLVAQSLAGSTAWAGLPGATIVIGSATGSMLLSRLMVRRGRRVGLTMGYVIGAGGAALAATSLVTASFVVFLVGTFLMGFANSANQLSRYTAADMFPLSRRATAIGTVVWGATIGAILGPNMVQPAGRLATSVGLPELSGAYLALVVFVGAAALLTQVRLRPDPYDLADTSQGEPVGHGRATGHHAPPHSAAELLRRPTVALSIVALIVGQVVMTLLMTMTPLHMTEAGHDLGFVGLVLSAHTFGMFALSPVSGKLTDRFGSPRTILAGMAVLAISAVLTIAAPADGGGLLLFALFLLGFGWNLGFVAGSAMLAAGLELAERTRLEGLTDALIWSAAAVASLSSGIIVMAAGFAALGILALGLVAIPTVLVLSRARTLPGAARA